MVSAKLLRTQCICKSHPSQTCDVHSVNHFWLFPALTFSRLSLPNSIFWHAFPSQKWVLLLQHPPRFRSFDILLFPLPILFLDLSKLHHSYADSSHSVFLQDGTNIKFCKGAEHTFNKTKAEPALCSPSSLETSAICSFSLQQIMPSGHCFTAEHHQKFVLTLQEPFWTDLSCAVSALQVTKPIRNSIFLWPWSHLLYFIPMAFMTTMFPHQAFAKYLVFSSLILFITSLLRPLPLIGFGDSGTTEGVFSPFVCKRCNCSCPPTFSVYKGYRSPFSSSLYSPSSFLAFIDSSIPTYVIFFPLGKKSPTNVSLLEHNKS